MTISKIFALSALTLAIAACGGGDVNIDAQNLSTEDNSVDTGGGDIVNGGAGVAQPTNPCAQYIAGGITLQGSFDVQTSNCKYGTDFVALTNPITQTQSQVTFADLPNDGVHIFEDSLVVGENYTTDQALMDAGISEGGDGAIIRLSAGATLAFETSADYMVINRGSQIFAEGTAAKPITITSVTDAVDGTVGAEDVSQWGGIVINGFGVVNKCEYTGIRGEAGFSGSDCHEVAEGREGVSATNYGGSNDADSSGALEYVVVKHSGAAVSEGNELNGISFGGVGSGTTVNFLQTYSTFDDGIEMFGGAVNISHFVATYVRDDSIDIDSGYIGTIDKALVIQSENDGNHCIESDGIAGHGSLTPEVRADFIARGLNSAATINNLTCIISPNAGGTHDPGAGWRIREAHTPTITDALLVGSYAADGIQGTDDNYCVRIADEGLQAAQDGDLVIQSTIIACQDLTKQGPLPDGTETRAFLEANNDVIQTAEAGEDPTSASAPNLVLLDGFYSVPVGGMIINGGPVNVVPTNTSRNMIGAVSADNDWTAGWAFGLHEDNRLQPLWFETATP